MSILPRSFYLRTDVLQIARDLLGKCLITRINGFTTSGLICEAEAYEGVTDRASHAYGGRITKRTEIMYARGGIAYVYLCYGMHSLFNVVTNETGIPHAVLIRGIIPVDGIPEMLHRAGKQQIMNDLGIGPGKVARILGIHYSHSGLDLVEQRPDSQVSIWIEDSGVQINPENIISGPRIGIDYAGDDAKLPYRFRVKNIYAKKNPDNAGFS